MNKTMYERQIWHTINAGMEQLTHRDDDTTCKRDIITGEITFFIKDRDWKPQRDIVNEEPPLLSVDDKYENLVVEMEQMKNTFNLRISLLENIIKSLTNN